MANMVVTFEFKIGDRVRHWDWSDVWVLAAASVAFLLAWKGWFGW